MSANTTEITIRPARKTGEIEVVEPISLRTIIASGTPTAVKAALITAYPAVPEGTWKSAIDNVFVREGVTIAVSTADRTHRNRPDYGPLKPDVEHLIPEA